jgi:HKD family nuclease
MKIINNLTPKNHSERIIELFKESTDVVIASPFLMKDFTSLLNGINMKPEASIKIITTLQRNSIEQIGKVQSLLSFIKHPKIKESKINISVAINNRLHGKIYVFSNGGTKRVIISSANFTNNGLVSNHEWGIELEDKEIITQILNDLEKTIEVDKITLIELENLNEAAKKFSESIKLPKQEIELDLIGLLPTRQSISTIPTNTNCWLKPVGVSADPITAGRKFSSLETRLNFSKRTPRSVKIGDILIAYGVGAKQILSIYRVGSKPSRVTEEDIAKEAWLERWPWYVIGENLTPNFGNEWWQHHFYLSQLKNDFQSQFPTIPITAEGGFTLGAINRGADKLNLRREFAEFIINKVVSINRQIDDVE